MKLGFLTALYRDRPLDAVLDIAVEHGFDAVELGTGAYPGSEHCPPDELLSDPVRARALREAVASRGLIISALSCHGNPVHPRADIRARHRDTWTATLQLAEMLEVGVVNAFSGCPGDGGDDARCPNWVTYPWPEEYETLLDTQWTEHVIPYWAAEAKEAAEHGVQIAIEMHPGFVVYHPETLLRLRRAAGDRIGANFDPSHLVWQGIDPVEAARELGSAGAIFNVHAKDTSLNAGNVRRNGVLDTKHHDQVLERAWSFRTVGYGLSEIEWRALVSTLRMVGYDDVLSVEHEDNLLSNDEGLERAVEFLRRVVPREPPDAAGSP